ncbi:MAG TPA: hypothetical protein GX521_03980 [Firmicutes bacterium]|nr:hypothetical protein [Bacillota bacterium]
MTTRPFRIYVGLFLVFALLSLSACSPPTPVIGKSSLTVMGTVSPASHQELVEARIILSRGKHSVEEVVPLQQNHFEAALQLPLGQWELSVLLIDAEGKVQFQSSPRQIDIGPQKPSMIELVLRPADSEVTIRIDLDGYLFRDLALRSRIHFDDKVHEITRENAHESLEKVLMIEPGSYEFKIELYTDSFRAGDRLGPGIWEIITIPPNQSLEIVWSPLALGLEIRGRLESLLPAPENIAVTPTEAGLAISWDEVYAPETNGYFLFAQNSPLDRFELLTPIPLKQPTYEYNLDHEQTSGQILFTAAAVSTGGLVGYYSAPCLWPIKAQD